MQKTYTASSAMEQRRTTGKSSYSRQRQSGGGRLLFKAAAKGVTGLMRNIKKKTTDLDTTLERINHFKYEIPLADEHHPDFQMHKKMLSTFFRTVDADGSDSLSVVEFMTALRVVGERLGPKFTRSDTMSLFAALDDDKGGTISEDELVTGILRLDDTHFLSICYAVDACIKMMDATKSKAHGKLGKVHRRPSYANHNLGSVAQTIPVDEQGEKRLVDSDEESARTLAEYRELVARNAQMERDMIEAKNRHRENTRRISTFEEKLVTKNLEVDLLKKQVEDLKAHGEGASAEELRELKEELEDLHEDSEKYLRERETLLDKVKLMEDELRVLRAASSSQSMSRDEHYQDMRAKLVARDDIIQSMAKDKSDLEVALVAAERERDRLRRRADRSKEDAMRARGIARKSSLAVTHADAHSEDGVLVLELRQKLAVVQAQEKHAQEQLANAKSKLAKLEGLEKHQQRLHKSSVNMRIMQAKINAQERRIAELEEELEMAGEGGPLPVPSAAGRDGMRDREEEQARKITKLKRKIKRMKTKYSSVSQRRRMSHRPMTSTVFVGIGIITASILTTT